MTEHARLPLIALLACVLAGSMPSPTAADAGAARSPGLRNQRKLQKVLRRKGLATLPSVAGALTGTSGKRRRAGAPLVSGTPPTLVSIGGSAVKDVFWRPGVVDAIAAGTASPEQCGEFWFGQADGQSGGMGACHMAEGVGYSLEDILSADTSLCYMKRFPTRANLRAGALALTAGEFPDGDPSHLFGVPAGGTSRVVKVSVTGLPEPGQDVFLRVHSADENTANGDLYAVDLWFCHGGATADGFEHTRITTDGAFTSEEQQNHSDGSNIASVTGYVTFAEGTVTYDTSRNRHAQVSSTHSGGSVKADHEIIGTDTIQSKSFDTYGGNDRHSYVIASFSGTSVDTLRFLTGAFKEQQTGPQAPPSDVIGSTEYRATFYAASPGSALESGLAAVDFATDPFYATPPSVVVDASAYACDLTPDVALTLDFSNPAGMAVRNVCEQRANDQMHFCHDDPDVHAAEMNIGPTCYGPH